MTKNFALISSIVAAGLFLPGCSTSSGTLTWRDDQPKWWTTSDVVYRSIVALLAARAVVDADGADDVVRRVDWAIQDSLLLFDDLDSDEAMARLVGLTSFYLGEASGEILDCLISRKGSRIAPLLETALREKGDACAQEFGRESAQCVGQRNRDALADRRRSLMMRIEDDAPCAIEK
jgi:hypothetical protein